MLKKYFVFCLFVISSVFEKVFAEAYLEGDEFAKGKSILDSLDSSLLMSNWYKIVFIIVGLLCIIGLIVGNIRWFLKKRNKK